MDFSETVMSRRERWGGEFRPFVTYDPDGDCIEFFMSNEDYLGRRIDSVLTLYVSRSDQRIPVGFLIKGAKKMLLEFQKRNPGFSAEKDKGKMPLEKIMTAHFWTMDAKSAAEFSVVYKKLRDAATQTNA